MIPLVKTECRRETAAAKAYESLWTTFTIHTQCNVDALSRSERRLLAVYGFCLVVSGIRVNNRNCWHNEKDSKALISRRPQLHATS